MYKDFSLAQSRIKDRLLSSPQIRQLLYYNGADALDKVAPTEEEVQDYIKLVPLPSLTRASDAYQQSVFISCSWDNIALSSTDCTGVLVVEVACSNDVWLLKDGTCRVFALMDLIHNYIDNQRFVLANSFEADAVDLKIYNDNFTGYIMTFVATHQTKSHTDFNESV